MIIFENCVTYFLILLNILLGLVYYFSPDFLPAILHPLKKAYEKICVKYVEEFVHRKISEFFNSKGTRDTLKSYCSSKTHAIKCASFAQTDVLKSNSFAQTDVLKSESFAQTDDISQSDSFAQTEDVLKCDSFTQIVDDKVQKPTLNLLFVGSYMSDKKSTFEFIVNKKGTNLLLSAQNVKHARNDDCFGWNVYAVECPGFQQSQSQCNKTIQDIDIVNFQNALKTMKNFHAIVFCTPFSKELSKEVMEYIKIMKSVLGTSEFEDRFLLAMTREEEFEHIKKEWCLKNILDFLKLYGSDEMKDLLNECNDRCILFNQNTDDEKVRMEQVAEFFMMAETMLYHNALYRVNGIKKRKIISSPLSNSAYCQNYNSISDLPKSEATYNNSHADIFLGPSNTAVSQPETDANTNIKQITHSVFSDLPPTEATFNQGNTDTTHELLSSAIMQPEQYNNSNLVTNSNLPDGDSIQAYDIGLNEIPERIACGSQRQVLLSNRQAK